MTKSRTTVRLVKRIRATPSKVFEALTIPENILRWWGVDGGPTLSAEVDLRPEGQYSIVFRMLDGSEHNPTGVYKEVVPASKLVFTWEWPGRPEWASRVTIELRPIDIGTELTLTHDDLPGDDAADSHEAGWTGLLEQLDRHLGDHE
jgi:uncharacterized protein YndB with AHSA1/START domain